MRTVLPRRAPVACAAAVVAAPSLDRLERSRPCGPDAVRISAGHVDRLECRVRGPTQCVDLPGAELELHMDVLVPSQPVFAYVTGSMLVIDGGVTAATGHVHFTRAFTGSD